MDNEEQLFLRQTLHSSRRHPLPAEKSNYGLYAGLSDVLGGSSVDTLNSPRSESGEASVSNEQSGTVDVQEAEGYADALF